MKNSIFLHIAANDIYMPAIFMFCTPFFKCLPAFEPANSALKDVHAETYIRRIMCTYSMFVRFLL